MQRFFSKLHLKDREQEIINGCLKGKASSQKQLYDSLAPKMFALCKRYMGNAEDAEDMLQEGFITLFSKLESFSGEGSFEGWARRIFVNTALMSLRKKDALKDSGEIELAKSIKSEEPSQIENLGQKEILALISALPSKYRVVFNMYVIEGYSHKEIAEVLDISEATSRSQLLRARAMLQEQIKG